MARLPDEANWEASGPSPLQTQGVCPSHAYRCDFRRTWRGCQTRRTRRRTRRCPSRSLALRCCGAWAGARGRCRPIPLSLSRPRSRNVAAPSTNTMKAARPVAGACLHASHVDCQRLAQCMPAVHRPAGSHRDVCSEMMNAHGCRAWGGARWGPRSRSSTCSGRTAWAWARSRPSRRCNLGFQAFSESKPCWAWARSPPGRRCNLGFWHLVGVNPAGQNLPGQILLGLGTGPAKPEVLQLLELGSKALRHCLLVLPAAAAAAGAACRCCCCCCCCTTGSSI